MSCLWLNTKQLKAQPAADSLVNHYVDLAWELKSSQPDSAFYWAKAGRVLAKEHSMFQEQSDAEVVLGVIYSLKAQYDSAHAYFNSARSIRSRLNNLKGVASTYNNEGAVYQKQGDFRSASSAFKKALKLYESENERGGEAMVLNQLGGLYAQLGSSDSAIIHLEKALAIREEENNPAKLSRSLLNLGNLHFDFQDYTNALRYARRSLTVLENDTSNTSHLSKIYNLLGNVYYAMDEPMKARSFYKRSVDLKESAGFRHGSALTYGNLGSIAVAQGDFEIALDYYAKSHSILEEIGDSNGLARTALLMGDAHILLGDFDAAETALNQSYGLAKAQQDLPLQLQVTESLSRLSLRLDRFREAAVYQREHTELQDALYSSFQQAQQLERENLEQKLAIKRMEAEEEKRTNQAARSRLTGIALLGLSALLIAIIFLLIRSNRQARRIIEADRLQKEAEDKVDNLLKEQELQAMNAMMEGQEEERKRIAMDLHDKLGSTLSMIKLYFNSVNEQLANLQGQVNEQYSKASQLLDEACDEVRKISHNMLSGVLVQFGLVTATRKIAESITDSKQLEVSVIAVNMDSRLSGTMELILYRIIQELMGNILKHAQAKEAIVQFNRFNGSLNIMVEDDGIGFNPEEVKRGVGLSSIEQRVKNLGGQFSIDSGKGNGTTISIDISVG